MKLELKTPAWYRVKHGQTIRSIAQTYGLTPRILARENDLDEEVREGMLLKIPQAAGNLYTVRGGESMTLLCGSKENFCEKNGTEHLYIGQTILL